LILINQRIGVVEDAKGVIFVEPSLVKMREIFLIYVAFDLYFPLTVAVQF
jgi:hypothetical protein